MRRKQGGTRGPLEREAGRALRESAAMMRRLERAAAGPVAAAAESMVASLRAGGTIYFCGNGGSAADAQHLACELAGRFLMDRPALAAVALSTNTSALTAIGNDYAFDEIFSRQLEGLAIPGDVLVAITTSGGSANVLRTVEIAQRLGMVVVGMTGAKGTRFAARCDHALVTPHVSTPRIQEGHIAMGHTLCELVERAMFPAPAAGPRRGRTSAKRAGPTGRATSAARSARGARRGRSAGRRRS